MRRALAECLYFMVILGPEAQEKTAALLENVLRAHGLSGKRVAPQRLHITLASLGAYEVELPRSVVEAARRAADRIAFRRCPVEFDRVAGARSLVLYGQSGLYDLRLLQRYLISELKHGPLMRFATKSFSPHITLAYGDINLPETAVEPLRWIVKDFALIHSRHGLTEHRLLGHWPLDPTPSLAAPATTARPEAGVLRLTPPPALLLRPKAA